MASRLTLLATVAAVGVTAAACGGSAHTHATASDLRSYVAAVEKVRLPVNSLLEDADPILDAYHEHKITPLQASHRFAAMEEKFAAYATQMQLITPADSQLRAINLPYAHTYFYEDSYLATLASDLREGDFDNLPNTQDAQRLAIIQWRIALEVLASKLGVTLPADLQQAGRGEIAPAIEGS